MEPCKIVKVVNIQKKPLQSHQTVEFDTIPGDKIQDYCSTDGLHLFTVSLNGTIAIFNSAGRIIEELDIQLEPDEEVKAMAITPQNEYIAIAYWDKKNLTSSICFLRISNPALFNDHATPTRVIAEQV